MNTNLRLEWILAVVGLGFLAGALRASWGDIVAGFAWSSERVLLAVAVDLAALTAFAGAWCMLDDPGRRGRAFRRYLMVQPAKHIPGGVAHPVGLISASSADRSLTDSVGQFVRLSILLVGAALSIGITLLSDASTRLAGLFALLGTIATLFLVLRLQSSQHVDRLILRTLRWISRGRVTAGRVAFEGTRSMYAISAALALVGMAFLSAGFAILAVSAEGMPNPVLLVGAFALAWVVGYLIVPFPAGLGLREAALVVILGSLAPSYGSVLAAAVIQRLCQVVAEVIAVAFGYGAEGVVRIPRRSVGAPDGPP